MAVAILDDLPEKWSNVDGKLVFRSRKSDETEAALGTITLDVSTLVTFTSNIAGCGASEISLCVDEACATLATLATNKVSPFLNPTSAASDGNIQSEL